MKILVHIKRVVDYQIRPRPTQDGKDVELTNVKMSINPFDENAVEGAVRLKEAGVATEVVVVAVGTAANQDVLRHALAMGADRAILVETPAVVQPLAAAKYLKAIVEREAPQLVLTGKQAIDDDAAETAQMVSALLNWPQATFASKIDIADGKALVVREIDGGQETLSLSLPAVVSVDLRLNEPRFIKLPALMMAKKKPIETLPAAEFAIAAPALEILNIAEPPARKPGKILNSVAELVAALRAEKVVS
ncbi:MULTISPECIES: electron transfer flavoprotein subunit beta/FixA family protein [Deefgea]|uniref:Electron transfer flavoprotein subunit beta n=1 Tax=Deefgea chitinilytica TaxID=570276 RepID=A0ABS2C7H8_9NEIS|nr:MULTISPECIES: electron transfer flavoprotein subunit beta/FixA family protein [Deefgea]MBM5570109.1 EtfB protein [Deefgea chitinilytica]MBM9887338.1 electron transfer flavoprotein subunit beta/FixA family protein [Deefgea sp. CFH1-16]